MKTAKGKDGQKGGFTKIIFVLAVPEDTLLGVAPFDNGGCENAIRLGDGQEKIRR